MFSVCMVKLPSLSHITQGQIVFCDKYKEWGK
jgi:hypothetical protein